MAAVHRDDAPGHERGGVGGEQQQGAVELLRPARPTLRDPAHEPLPLFGLQELAVEVGLDVAGGKRALTRTACRASSAPIARVSCTSPPLAAMYSGICIATRPWPITDAMLMMLPPWPSRDHAPRALEGHEVGAAEVHPGNRLPVGLVVLEQRLVDDDAGVVDEHVDPAERAGRGAVDAPVRTEAPSATSMPTGTASPPAAAISRASTSSRSTRRAASATLAPSPARVSANCRPRPEDAPVTIARLPRTLNLPFMARDLSGKEHGVGAGLRDRERNLVPAPFPSFMRGGALSGSGAQFRSPGGIAARLAASIHEARP